MPVGDPGGWQAVAQTLDVMIGPGCSRYSDSVVWGGMLRRIGTLRGCEMGYNFLPWDHDQQYLLPPDIRDRLPADHEVWALLKAAGLLDFSDFFARRREDG